jgi:hypothetical protein
MTHVRRRTTKAGSISTALVESYRDEKGRPRQRLLANLHGEPDTVSAVAKLEFKRDGLRKHRDEWPGSEDDTGNEDDRMMMADYFEEGLASLENEISVIKKHCSANTDEIQAAIAAHKIALDDAVAIAIGSLMYVHRHEDAHKAAKAKLRRIRH